MSEPWPIAPTPRITVLIAGETPAKSAPSLTLAEALAPYGIVPLFSDGTDTLFIWLRKFRRSDVVIYIGYDGPDCYSLRQLALAVAAGVPLIRWWVGTDVLTCIENPASARRSRFLDRFCAERVTGTPQLQQELASAGIRATLIPTVINPGFLASSLDAGEVPRAVLVYLPTARGPFYGEDVIRQSIHANPDLDFIVIADEEHRFAKFPNVTSLGWVEDMRPLYQRVGCLLRLTEHDSLPRMAIEALLLGKYVICTHEFPGCWLARNSEQVLNRLMEFRNSTAANVEGARAMRQLLTPPPAQRFADLIRASVGTTSLAKRGGALALVPLLALLARFRI